MAPRASRSRSAKLRVGKVTVYPHHGSWWVYYRDGGKPVRRKVASTRPDAEQVAAQVNAQLAQGAPTLLAFTAIGVGELRRAFLDYHENVLGSTLSTVSRYRAATQHLLDFVSCTPRPPLAHDVRADRFAAYLREVEVAPNGHANTAKRRLRDKGVQFILETCRAMYAYAGKKRHLPPYVANPFAELPIDRMRIEDSKPIFVFDEATERAFFENAPRWAFAIHFTLAKTGLRVGELVHLLIEDLDLARGWLTVRNRPELGWRVKTGHGRIVPLVTELVLVLKMAIGIRVQGLVFVREQLEGCPALSGDSTALVKEFQLRCAAVGRPLTRVERHGLARRVWHEAGAVSADAIRNSFCRLMKKLGHLAATCPKSWRHTFATLLQDSNVDPLIRQLTLGHATTSAGGLGMTANYTHTRPETQKNQIEQALRRWPESLKLAQSFSEPLAHGGA